MSTDYAQAACLDIWPEEFSDGGTPIAWAACHSCPIELQCRADAKREGTYGVYRGGMAFGEVTGKTIRNKRAWRPKRRRGAA